MLVLLGVAAAAGVVAVCVSESPRKVATRIGVAVLAVAAMLLLFFGVWLIPLLSGGGI